MKIVAGSSSPMLAKNIARLMNMELADVSIKRFPDGECYVKFNEKIEHAVVVQNTYPDENLVELFIIQDALKRMNAKVDIVIPYYGYGRQDKVFEEGEAISAEKMAKLIEMDANHVILISGSEVRMEVKNMDVEGKRILILDDIISTGGTMAKAVELLKKRGASKIYAACVHGLFIGNADERIIQAGCDGLVATDTIESSYSMVSVAEEVVKLLKS